MRIETTYKYILHNGWEICFEQNSYNRRRIRRAGRHQANLDLKRSICEALDDVYFANIQMVEGSFDHQGFDDYNDFEDYLNDEPDYEAQAAEWERDNNEEWEYEDNWD